MQEITRSPLRNGRQIFRDEEMRKYLDGLEKIDLNELGFESLEKYEMSKGTVTFEETEGRYGLKGLRSLTGDVAIPCCYDDISVGRSYIAAHYGGKVDFYSRCGTPLLIAGDGEYNRVDGLVSPRPPHVDTCGDGVFIVDNYSHNRLIDICDCTGIVLRTNFKPDYYRYQKDGVAIVGEAGGQYLTNFLTGNDLTDEYYEIRRFSENVAVARRFDRQGRQVYVCLDLDGKEVLVMPAFREVISNCHEGLIVVRDLVDDEISFVSPFDHQMIGTCWAVEEATSFHNGVAALRFRDGSVHHINRQMETID